MVHARLTALVAELAHVAGVRVLVVDDGSGPRFASVFAQAERTGAEVLVHEMNHGKGVALRTGFAYARTMYPGEPVVSEREYWRARHAATESSPNPRCC